MDNRSTPAATEDKQPLHPVSDKGRFIRLCILIFTSSCVFTFLESKHVFLFITSFAIATGILAFFFKHKLYAFVIVPASFSCLAFPHFKFLIPTLLFMILLAFLCASYLKDRPGQFVFFTMCALMYSLAAIGGCVLVAVQYFGSVEACLEAVTQYSATVAELLFNRIPERLTAKVSAEDLAMIKEAYLGAAGQVVYLIPSTLVISSMYAAALTKSTLTKALGGKKMLPVLFSTPYYPPTALAVVYIVLSLIGIIFALSAEEAYYMYMNVMTVMGVIFAGIGLVEYVSVLKNPVHPKQRVVYIVMGIMVVGIFAMSAFSILAYYGAYRTIFSRVRVIRITKK